MIDHHGDGSLVILSFGQRERIWWRIPLSVHLIS
jgi:hypothetical protein